MWVLVLLPYYNNKKPISVPIDIHKILILGGHAVIIINFHEILKALMFWYMKVDTSKKIPEQQSGAK